jgi:N utilization substance protein B
MNKKPSPSQRRKARRLALQAIYQWQLSNLSSAEIETQFLEDHLLDKTDVPYFLELLRGVVKYVKTLDELMEPVLDRPIKDINPVELAILRIAIFELAHRLDIPYRVVIDEGLRLAKTFGAMEGYKYVNAILDQLAKTLRTVERG